MISQIKFRAMGCWMEVQVDHSADRPASQILEQIPLIFENWEAHLSRFRSDSELSRLNLSGGTPTQVSQVLWQTLQSAIWAEAQSAGLVSAAVLPAVLTAGYTSSFDQMVSGAISGLPRGSAASPAPSLSTIRLDTANHTICLPQGMQLDFGGVAKGWAADQAVHRLEVLGPAMVDAGGDLAISGLRHGKEPWVISIEDPRASGETLGTLRLGRGGVATSGIDYRRWQQDGNWRHHIIDPRSGQPAETDVLTATVVAPNVMEAEMAAKVVLILGSQDGLAWLARRPRWAGLLVLQDGRVMGSPALQQMVTAAAKRRQ